MFVLDIIILVLLIIVMFYSPTYRGVNRANQVLDSKLDKLLSRSDASAGTEQLAEALGEIRGDLDQIRADLDKGLNQLERIKEQLRQL